MPIREGFLPVEHAALYYREIGQGRPIVVLHGGPDFNHAYLLPELDQLADSYRLIYYDQRGRGKSAAGVRPEDVSLASELADLDRLLDAFQLETAALLGHSWGGLLALEYALSRPRRVSHLILLNTAPASRRDSLRFRRERRAAAPEDFARLQALAAAPGFAQGDLAADAAYYRVHFRRALHRPEHLEPLVSRLRLHFTSQTVVLARAIEERLYDQTWSSPGYNLLPGLARLALPALVIHGAEDFIPVKYAAHIAQAIPAARLAVLPETGHFSFLESPAAVRREITAFLPTY